MSEEPVERFVPTSGRILGVLALTLVAGVVLIRVLDRDSGLPTPVVWATLALGVLAWSTMLRPRVWVTGDDLVLRNMLDTTRVPLAAIERVIVQQTLVVNAGEKRFVSPAIGKSWRQTIKQNRAASRPTALDSYPVFVEERISQLAEDARAQRGITHLSDEQLALAADVRRDYAWLEISGLAVSVAGFIVSLVL